MNYQVNAHYTEDIIRSATFEIWKKNLGKELYWSVPVLTLSIIAINGFPDVWYYGGFFLIVSLVATLGVGIGYYQYLNRALSLFREMEGSDSEWNFSEDKFLIKTNMGEASVNWKVLKEIVECKGYILFIFKTGTYTTLPTENVSAECIDFILDSHNNSMKFS